MIERVPGEIILRAIMGSHAYGLNHAGSDEDRLGIYLADTNDILGLRPPAETLTSHDPSDVTYHEFGKFVRLAMKANPTVLELLWRGDYEIKTLAGEQLIDIREAFLSAPAVYKAFGGYAHQQFQRLQTRGNFDPGMQKRRAKHARHLLRLLWQGQQLMETGSMQVMLTPDQVDEVRAFGDLEVDEMVAWATTYFAAFEEAAAENTLPFDPDLDVIEDTLLDIRINAFASSSGILVLR